MDPQIQAALLGAVVGAVAVGVVTHFSEHSKERKIAGRAFDILLAFHGRWSDVSEASQQIQKRNYPLLLQSFEEILPLIMQEGHSSTRKLLFDYSIELRQLSTYVQAGSFGLTNGPEARLKKIVDEMKSELRQEGILGFLE